MGIEFDHQRTLLSISLLCWSCCWWLYLDLLYAAVFPPSHRLFLFSLSTFPPLLLVIAYVTGHLTYPIQLTSIDVDDDNDDDHRSFLSRVIAQLREAVIVRLPVTLLVYLVLRFFMASSAIHDYVGCTTSLGFLFAVVYIGGAGFYLVSLQDADWIRYWMLVYVLGVLAYVVPFIGDNPQPEKRKLVIILSVVIALLCKSVHSFREEQENRLSSFKNQP